MLTILRCRFGDVDELDYLARRLAAYDDDGDLVGVALVLRLPELWAVSSALITRATPIEITVQPE